jgi:cytoskeletal protein CcmA (bactofilin family)
MSEENKNPEPMTFPGNPAYQATARPVQPQAGPLTRPDFENNLAAFRAEFFQFVAETDPDFELELLQNNPAPPPPPAPTHPASEEVWHPTRKDEIAGPLRLSGPKVIGGDILGDQVQLVGDVRVKGNLYGRNGVHIGPGCVIEGHVISGGPLKIEAGSRVEGAVVGNNISLSGPLFVQGPVVSHQSLETWGQLEAQALYAGTNLSLKGTASDEVRVEAGLILAKAGNLDVSTRVSLARQKVDPDRQKFYLAQGEGGNIILTPVAELSQLSPEEGYRTTVLTTLSDAGLEKLLAELETLKS